MPGGCLQPPPEAGPGPHCAPCSADCLRPQDLGKKQTGLCAVFWGSQDGGKTSRSDLHAAEPSPLPCSRLRWCWGRALALALAQAAGLWAVTLGRDRAAWSNFRRCCGSLMPISRRSCSSITLDPWEQKGEHEGPLNGQLAATAVSGQPFTAPPNSSILPQAPSWSGVLGLPEEARPGSKRLCACRRPH